MHDMVKIIKQSDRKGKRVFQRLPRYKRRRAMSWNIHILPKQLRKSAEVETGPARIKHRKRRKHKRRKNRFYKNRLLTHLFHVKRMTMGEKWGVTIPLVHHEKIYRTTYRFQSQRCTMYDASYFLCYQFTSKNKQLIVNLLKPFVKGSLDHVMFFSGKREGTIHIYNKECVGPAKFVWKHSDLKENAQLWLWIHPAMVGDLPILRRDSVKMSIRKDLARYELRGPMATSTIASVLMVNKNSPPMSLKVFGQMCGEGSRPDSLPKNMILCVTIDLPTKEMKRIKIDPSKSQPMLELPDGLVGTDLWTNETSLDVMLIQQPFPVFGSGWDIICNAKHGVHIWSRISNLNGVVPLPLKDRNRMFTENRLGIFPDDYPDTKAIGNKTIVPISRFLGDPGMIPVIGLFKTGGSTKSGAFLHKILQKTTKPIKFNSKLEKIGFVTTTTYSMNAGMNILIGFIDGKHFIEQKEANCLLNYNQDLYMYPCSLEKRF
jgi:hypothetical protein